MRVISGLSQSSGQNVLLADKNASGSLNLAKSVKELIEKIASKKPQLIASSHKACILGYLKKEAHPLD